MTSLKVENAPSRVARGTYESWKANIIMHCEDCRNKLCSDFVQSALSRQTITPDIDYRLGNIFTYILPSC